MNKRINIGDIVKVIDAKTHRLSIWKADLVGKIGYVTQSANNYCLISFFDRNLYASFSIKNLQKISE